MVTRMHHAAQACHTRGFGGVWVDRPSCRTHTPHPSFLFFPPGKPLIVLFEFVSNIKRLTLLSCVIFIIRFFSNIIQYFQGTLLTSFWLPKFCEWGERGRWKLKGVHKRIQVEGESSPLKKVIESLKFFFSPIYNRLCYSLYPFDAQRGGGALGRKK